MSLWTRFLSWTNATLRPSRMEREMEEEMRFHIEARATDLMKSGLTPNRRAGQRINGRRQKRPNTMAASAKSAIGTDTPACSR